MIEMPRRSVTRFFIPLIDVLILMVCIFLLMPFIGAGENAGRDTKGTEGLNANEREELARLRKEAKERAAELSQAERQELERLRRERIGFLRERLAVKVLEIDGATGKLYFHDPERLEIKNEADAHALIARKRKEAPGKENYYLFLYPRAKGFYPLNTQIQSYNRWFSAVPHGEDVPGS